MSHIQRPFTRPIHPQLLEEINEACIAIELHHNIKLETAEKPEAIIEARKRHQEPDWKYMVDLLSKCRNAINEQREDPRKY